jgi:hypothetical protein
VADRVVIEGEAGIGNPRFGSEETLFLSTLAFVEFADDDHAAVDAALTRMYRCTENTGTRDFVPDRSEPSESLRGWA